MSMLWHAHDAAEYWKLQGHCKWEGIGIDTKQGGKNVLTNQAILPYHGVFMWSQNGRSPWTQLIFKQW